MCIRDRERRVQATSEFWSLRFKQLHISGVSCSSNFGKCEMVPRVRTWNCEGWIERRRRLRGVA
eukprot:2428287-Alexandrium_andersonii.AAC.1